MLLLRPEIPFRFQMVEHGVGVASCPVLQQAVGADFVQPQLLHPLVPAAPQNVPQQIRAHIVAKGVVYPLHAGENDLRFPGDVHRLEIPLAAAAVAAHRRVLLPEVVQNVAPQAAFRLAVADHGVQPFQILPPHLLPLHGVHFLVVGAVVDKEPGGLHVSGVEQQNAVRLCPVPSGAPGLLIVGFNAFRHIVVNDKADVGFVDAHAESVCCHHHGLAVVQEILLIFASLGFGKPRVIPGGGVAVIT